MKFETINVRCIGIDPYRSGVAFAVFDTPHFLLDWGSVETGKDTEDILREVRELIDRYGPNLLFLEDPNNTLRGDRFKNLALEIGKLARNLGVAVRHVGLDRGARNDPESRVTKRDWVRRVVAVFPQLGNYRLAPRRPWDSESHGIQIIDAASLIVKELDLEPVQPPRSDHEAREAA